MPMDSPIRVVAALFLLTPAAQAAPSLTVYNDNFAVVREVVPLTLKKGENKVRFTEIAAFAEPSSVMLRDLKSGARLSVLEQDYRGDLTSQDRLLRAMVGKELDFVKDGEPPRVTRGKVVRAGAPAGVWRQDMYRTTQRPAQPPIIEVEGKLRFSLPGQPVFPPLDDDSVLEPSVEWLLDSEADRRLDAELAYITGNMGWSATYNVVAPEDSDVADLTAWVTVENNSGRTFKDARLKLMAGDVNRTPAANVYAGDAGGLSFLGARMSAAGKPQFAEKPFDDYRLYTLARAVTLRDGESKQVEFARAAGIQTKRRYVYDGVRIQQGYQSYDMNGIRGMQDYGTLSNPKVWVMREFLNSSKNGLGLPLPRGKMRFFRRDADGQLEMTGESLLDHTPQDETVRIYTGNAFDLVGERKRVHYFTSGSPNVVQEKFEIRVRNGGKKPTTVAVVEHLYRWSNWEISQNSHPFKKLDSQTVEFEVEAVPGKEALVKYEVHYTW
ncbi:DUF4139 domain-containing protein [bacterium]|nr:MAG: DUF4139 domain-containing protein [bacterium]